MLRGQERREAIQQLREQEAWGKWNTAPLANRIYGKAFKTRLGWRGWDYLVFIATYAFYGYIIWSFVSPWL